MTVVLHDLISEAKPDGNDVEYALVRNVLVNGVRRLRLNGMAVSRFTISMVR